MNVAQADSADKKGAYVVSYVDFPAQAIRADKIDAILDGSARGMAANTGATITEQTRIKFGAHPGLDVAAEAPRKASASRPSSEARFLLVGNRFYQILLVVPKSRAGAGEFQTFRDSFSLIRDVPPVAQGVAAARPMPAPAPPLRPALPGGVAAFVGESGPDPAGPAEVEIRVDYDPAKALDRIRPGGFNENPFRDLAPPGGILVGLRVGYVDAWGGTKLGSVRPIYQAGAQYVEGERAGNPEAELGEARVVARPGYAVAGINYRAGLIVDAVQLVFGKVKAGRIDLRDSYTSPWLGDADGGTLMFVSGEGRLIAGVVGRSSGREINGIGLAVVTGPINAKATASSPTAASPKAAPSTAAKPSTSTSTATKPEPSPKPAPASVARRDPTPAPDPTPADEPAPEPSPAPAVDPLAILDTTPAPDPATLAAASRRPAPVALAISYDADRLADVPPTRGDEREAFRDVAPRGAVLVGVRVGYIKSFGGDKVGAIQPIYQAGGGYVPGRRHGAGTVRGGATVMARPGYAVGAINLRAGIIVDAVQLVFMRAEDGRLNPGDSYTSDWLGDPSGGSPSTASGEGRPVAGLRGQADGKEVKGLGLVVGN